MLAPYSLFADIAEAVVVGARILACNTDNSSLALIDANTANQKSWTRCALRSLTQWAEELEFAAEGLDRPNEF